MSYVLTSATDFTTSDTITGESSSASVIVSAVTGGSVTITSDFELIQVCVITSTTYLV